MKKSLVACQLLTVATLSNPQSMSSCKKKGRVLFVPGANPSKDSIYGCEGE